MILVAKSSIPNHGIPVRGRVMFEHRLREWFAQPMSAAVMAAPAPAFVPCPVFLASAGQSFVAEVYRVAREMTEAQLRTPHRPWPPAFSLHCQAALPAPGRAGRPSGAARSISRPIESGIGPALPIGSGSECRRTLRWCRTITSQQARRARVSDAELD